MPVRTKPPSVDDKAQDLGGNLTQMGRSQTTGGFLLQFSELLPDKDR